MLGKINSSRKMKSSHLVPEQSYSLVFPYHNLYVSPNHNIKKNNDIIWEHVLGCDREGLGNNLIL